MPNKWWDGINCLEFDIELIDYRKYLNCPKCKAVELYCLKHRNEVEMIMATRSIKKQKLS